MCRSRCGTLSAIREEAPIDTLTLGVEEEYLLVDHQSGALASCADRVIDRTAPTLGETVSPELNLCQIEIGSSVCKTLDEVHGDLVRLRRALNAAAREVGCAIAATGTHPFSSWEDQSISAFVPRYQRMAETYQIVARQQVICGCHVHIGVEDLDLRIDIMNRVRPWLPVLMALSANSPYWRGLDSGFSSYRSQIWTRWPTAGMPPTLDDHAAYQRLVDELKTAEAIDDATYLYWYVRPSGRYPTIELRVMDVCTDLDDAVAMAGLARALVWTCGTNAERGVPRLVHRPEALEVAMWRACRFGLGGDLLHPREHRRRPAAEVVRELLRTIREGLDAHGDTARVNDYVEAILARGNGADRQRRSYRRRGSVGDVIGDVVTATTRVGQVVG